MGVWGAPTNANAVQLNRGPSAIQGWWELKQLPEDGAETEERANQYRYWLDEQLMNRDMDPGFCIWSNNNNDYPQHIDRRIFGHVMQLHNEVVLHHMRKHRRVTSTDTKWLIFERPEN